MPSRLNFRRHCPTSMGPMQQCSGSLTDSVKFELQRESDSIDYMGHEEITDIKSSQKWGQMTII